MTLRLILMRHAKSDWEDPSLGDHARPLNRRGRRAAKAMGDWLRARNYTPDTALVSSARRTRETWDRLDLDATPHFLDALYHATPAGMLNALQSAQGGAVLMLGHNPGIGALASALPATPPDHPRFYDYPTCATLVMDFDATDWRAIRPGTARCVDFCVPRDLTG